MTDKYYDENYDKLCDNMKILLKDWITEEKIIENLDINKKQFNRIFNFIKEKSFIKIKNNKFKIIKINNIF